jgi:hypothetical protein
MKEISSMDFPQHGEVFYFSGQALNAINPLVAFYTTHGRKREVLFFYFVSDTTRDIIITSQIIVTL